MVERGDNSHGYPFQPWTRFPPLNVRYNTSCYVRTMESTPHMHRKEEEDRRERSVRPVQEVITF